MKDKIFDYISGQEIPATPEELDAVQPFSQRLVDDFNYPKTHIRTRPQFHVRNSPSDVSKKYPVDIAVFHSEDHIEENLYMIVECKHKKIKDGIRQLKIYLDLSPAVIGAWYNGSEHYYIRKVFSKSGKIEYQKLPTLPRYKQRIEDIGLFKKGDLKATVNLRTVFKDIRNHIAGNATGVTRDETIASEIINLLFCKIYDEINTAPKEILEFRHGINESDNDIQHRILQLFENVKSEYSDVFATTDFIKLDKKSIAYIVGELQNYCVTEASRDIIGEAFEVFIGPALKGSQGQFFTPRNVVKTAIEIIDPGKSDKIIDPACGSGGFLLVALEHVWNKINLEAKKRGFGKHWIRKNEEDFARKNVRGIEKDSFLSKITKAYMAIIGDGRGGIFCENSLDLVENWHSETKAKVQLESYDVVLTNPPFGSKITITEKSILNSFTLGRKWKKNKDKTWSTTDKVLSKQPPQILFIERCWQLLRPGGKLGIILPDGILGGAKIGYVPDWIIKHFNFIACIDCPTETFSPNTTTKVHLLVLEKKKDKSPNTKDVFMAIPEIVGHDKKGHLVYSDLKNKIIHDDLEAVKKNWVKFKNGKLKSDSSFGYRIKNIELEESLNAKRYLPFFMKNLRFVRNYKGTQFSLNNLKEKLCTGANVDNLDYVGKNTPEAKPYILVKNVLDEGLSCSNLKFISNECYLKNKSSVCKTGDIIINRCGDAGVAAIVPPDLNGALACGFCFILRVKKEFSPEYIVSFLNSPFGRLQLKRLAIGSVLEHITKDDLLEVIVIFPKKKIDIDKIISAQKSAVSLRVKARKELGDIDNSFTNLF